MKLKYLQENQLFELVGDSRKSKASLFLVFVVVVVAAARLELRFPRFKVISRVFRGIWKDTFNSSKFLQLFIKFKQGTHHYGTAYAGPAFARRPRRRRTDYWTVICLCLGAYRKPIFLVLHLKIKLFPMFSITIDLVGKYRTQATARRRSRERTLSWTNWLVQ